jgi:phosphate transport system protein
MAKNLERIGDHATNIAETIYYEITGQEFMGERPRWNPDTVEAAPEPLSPV